ncbi:MAG: SH3 domain-containing protein [Anaerolineales bacterium]|nr:MAG: SH3 domain-containing protein [Anaerolineales bacterium]
MTKWPQEFWLTKPLVVMVMLIFASSLVVGCGIASPVPPISTPFSYPVRVLVKGTNENIPSARVTIEVDGKAPLDDITDSNGFVRIDIPSSHAGQRGKLIVEATGYKRYTQEIDLIEDILPTIILLRLEAGAVGALPSPIYTATPTSTPMLTSTSITTDTPAQPYPAPTLVSPASEATIMGEKLTNFSWHWDGALQEGEKFDLRIWRSGEPASSVSIRREVSCLLDTPPDGFGQYLWQVAVVRIDDSGSKLTLSESPIGSFVWSDVPSTARLTPTPRPDAVVDVENLHLRSDPGKDYDSVRTLRKGDPLKITGKNLDGDWLGVVCSDGKTGWVVASCLKINISLTGVPVVYFPPTPTLTCTPTPTPTATPLPAPQLLDPGDAGRFSEHSVLLKWKWTRPLGEDEYFSLRVRPEKDSEACCHPHTKATQYSGSLVGCKDGRHYWSVVVARRDPESPTGWQEISKPSEEQWFDFFRPDEDG